MAPCVEQDSLIEGLILCHDDQGTVFTPCSLASHYLDDPQGRNFKAVKFSKQVLRPMVAQTALAQAGVYEDVVQGSGPHRAVFPGQAGCLGESGLGQPVGFIKMNPWTEGQQGLTQFNSALLIEAAGQAIVR